MSGWTFFSARKSIVGEEVVCRPSRRRCWNGRLVEDGQPVDFDGEADAGHRWLDGGHLESPILRSVRGAWRSAVFTSLSNPKMYWMPGSRSSSR